MRKSVSVSVVVVRDDIGFIPPEHDRGDIVSRQKKRRWNQDLYVSAAWSLSRAGSRTGSKSEGVVGSR